MAEKIAMTQRSMVVDENSRIGNQKWTQYLAAFIGNFRLKINNQLSLLLLLLPENKRAIIVYSDDWWVHRGHNPCVDSSSRSNDGKKSIRIRGNERKSCVDRSIHAARCHAWMSSYSRPCRQIGP